jgi:cytochrome c5
MPQLLGAAALFLGVFLYASTQAIGQSRAAPQSAPPAADGKEILTRKCFQCHQASMWSSLRQDRKAWEGALYRMVGRGALWTEAEINAMAEFLAQTRGPK